MSEWAPLAAALVSGVFSAPVWNYFARRAGWGQSEIDRLRGEHRKCESALRDLNGRVAIVEQHHASAFARWISDAKRRIVWVNAKALVSLFGPMGYEREDIEGRTFRELLDKQAADELDMLAQAALAHDGSAVSNLIQMHPDLPIMHVVKIATAGRGGELIYDAIAFRTNDPEVALGLGVIRNAKQRAASIDNLAGDPEE